VDELGCQEIRFERNNEFTGFRVGDERGDNDVGIDNQLHSLRLLRLLFNLLACALVEFVGHIGDVALGEFTAGRVFVHHFKCLNFSWMACRVTSLQLISGCLSIRSLRSSSALTVILGIQKTMYTQNLVFLDWNTAARTDR